MSFISHYSTHTGTEAHHGGVRWDRLLPLFGCAAFWAAVATLVIR